MKCIMPQIGHYTSVGYNSGSRLTNVDGVSASPGYSGDTHEDLSRERMVGFSRLFMRNNPIYRGIIGRCVSYVVGKGFMLQASTKDSGWNAAAEMLWNDYWQAPEVRGLYSGKRYEALVFQELITTGDVFSVFVKPSGEQTKLQVFESEQCTSSRKGSDNGILFDEYGRPTEYNLVGYGKGGYVQRGKNLLNAKNVIHLFEPERASSTRGVPALQSAFSMLHRINDICDAEAVARQMLAHLAIAVNRDQADSAAYQESEADPNDDDFRIQEFDYGTIFHGAPGDTIAGISRNIPGADFEQSMRMFLRVLGLPLGLPLEIVILDWTKSNYSQSRAVLQQCFQNFSYWQNILKNRHLTRIYKRKIAEWVNGGLLTATDGMELHEWIAPSFPWIDEAKEVNAQSKKIELGLVSHDEICKALQRDRETVVTQREAEITDAIKRAQAIETETGVPVPYQVFCGLPIQNAHLLNAPEPEPEPELEPEENEEDEPEQGDTGNDDAESGE